MNNSDIARERSGLVTASGMAGVVLGALMLVGGCTTAETRDQDQQASSVSLSDNEVVDIEVVDVDVAADAGAFVIEGASYADVFGAARDVLAVYRFGINRVDAARGVITTFPKRTAGLATLWDREQSSLGQELEDFANQQEREIRIVFDRADPADEGDSEMSIVRATVRVDVMRVHRPHRRVETESIRMSTYARSRDGMGRSGVAEYREAIGQDQALAQRIADEIQARFD